MIFELSIIREIKDFPLICHCASILETKKDHYICVWYEGSYETSYDTLIKIAHKNSNTVEWIPSKILFCYHNVPLGNPVLFSFDDKRIFIIFSFLFEGSWKESVLVISYSDNNGEIWSNPSLLFPKKGFLAKNKPIKLSSGKIVVPIYSEIEFCPYVIIVDDINRCIESKYVAETMARGKAIQPVIVELEPKKLLMYCRTNQGTIWKSISYNDGFTWSICEPTIIPNPNSAIDLLKISSGELIMVFNSSEKDRHSLRVALSSNGGDTWSYFKDIEKGKGEYSYPCLIQDSNKSFHIVYTESRYRIKHVQFDLEWLKQ